MKILDIVEIVIFFIVLLVLVKPLGLYMAWVYQGKYLLPIRWMHPIEKFIYRFAGVQPDQEMNWKSYAVNLLVFNFFGFLFLYAILSLQEYLPLNPENFSAFQPLLAFNTAISFVTNTNWQNYSGELSLSHFTQMFGLTVQNFLSAATGMAVLVAFIRGLTRKSANSIGNYWVDLTRSVLYILLPLSFFFAFILVSQGVVQTFRPYQDVTLQEPFTTVAGEHIYEQRLALGPAASQVAIKQLGTNGGGFFNSNSSHPFENPTPLTNFLEMLAIILIPAALCYTFGEMVGDRSQGWSLLIAMVFLFTVLLGVMLYSEWNNYPRSINKNMTQALSINNQRYFLEGKENRFGISGSALWATLTTAASNGSVNSMHDSFSPIGGLVCMFLMQLGEVVFGGVGSGLYGMMAFVIVAVFAAGLMVGRTPEYLGKKIEVFEMKMSSLVILIPVLTVLFGTALAVSVPSARASDQ